MIMSVITTCSKTASRWSLPRCRQMLKNSSYGVHNEASSRGFTPSQYRGIDYLREARLYKGTAFSLAERQTLGIHGLLPAGFRTMEEQLDLCRLSFSRYSEDLNKYVYMMELQDRNEKLFFRLLTEEVETMMPIVYTPTVGVACQKFGLIFHRPRGLFITINDRGHVYDVLRNWPEPEVRAVVVTDGERILGLGDLGACGMGIPVGKLSLYTALAGIQPHHCLPVHIDVGTNNEEFLNDPLYLGLRRRRAHGNVYEALIDEFMDAVVRRYGQNTLIQFEDFANRNAFRFLQKYRNSYCTFNDDIQGTAAVVLAGMYASRKIVDRKISDHTFLFLGAGSASIGIANLLVKAMESEGTSADAACDKVWMFDIHGLLVESRKDLGEQQEVYAKQHEPSSNFAEVVKQVKPTVLLGASAAPGAFTREVLESMRNNNERPIIFALSNPTSKCECTAQEAYDYTEGRCLFVSGSPFPPVQFNGKTFHTGQGNNAHIFPGVALGVIVSGTHHIPDDIFVTAAKSVANQVSDEDITNGALYPPASRIKDCSSQIALDVIEYAYRNAIASTYPEPEDKVAFVQSNQYSFCYDSALPVKWTWPKDSCRIAQDTNILKG
ncbi:NADP-dependent malic enzyme-like [Toxorhynchites rutilus septentrionalis]|uniref:NADP-dependent malic enzyme-like n=1 Tax=Toxorhynchites rutilus septentrionalis TaxID=329112 RepID=UPI002478888C|nr:NADP-dependent malic enzyme-like [Toxorhynchites rutilus septentrionalis]XP_055617544.1 NADP-dependent malic enzyme-like [Toxorhynchites rutilus septentrionalis]